MGLYIEDILAFGGNSKVELVNVGDKAQVFWNVGNLNPGGYTSLGDGADIVGTIIAEDYGHMDFQKRNKNIEQAVPIQTFRFLRWLWFRP